MNLYHVSQNLVTGYDTYSDFVVCAIDQNAARSIHPVDGHIMNEEDLDDTYQCWAKSPKDVMVEYLGKADDRIKPGIICSSFHAG
jgi:hypothetical protein